MLRRTAISLLVTVALTATGSAAASSASDLPTKAPQAKKNVGGVPDTFPDTGWVSAVLQKGYARNGGYGQSCTASLGAARFVLTAAHCSLNNRETRVLAPWKLKVRVGSKYWNSGAAVVGPGLLSAGVWDVGTMSIGEFVGRVERAASGT